MNHTCPNCGHVDAISDKAIAKYVAAANGSKGGKARLKKMTSIRRSEIARNAGLASGAAKRKKKMEDGR